MGLKRRIKMAAWANGAGEPRQWRWKQWNNVVIGCAGDGGMAPGGVESRADRWCGDGSRKTASVACKSERPQSGTRRVTGAEGLGCRNVQRRGPAEKTHSTPRKGQAEAGPSVPLVLDMVGQGTALKGIREICRPDRSLRESREQGRRKESMYGSISSALGTSGDRKSRLWNPVGESGGAWWPWLEAAHGGALTYAPCTTS